MAINQGTTTTALSLVQSTTTSAAIDCRGFDSVIVEIAVTVAVKLWTVALSGANAVDGTFNALSTGATAMSKQTNTTYCGVWRGVPDWVKVTATEDEDTGKCTVKITPCNVKR